MNKHWFFFFLVFLMNLFFLATTVHAGEAMRPAMATTPTAKSWVMQGAFGVGQLRAPSTHRFGPLDRTVYENDFHNETNADYGVFMPSIQRAFTDRLHISFLSPGIAYRFGQRGQTETVPFFRLSFGVGYTESSGGTFMLTPLVGVTERHWFGQHTAFSWTLSTYSYLRHVENESCDVGCGNRAVYFEYGSLLLALAVIRDVSPRLSLAPGVQMALSWNRRTHEVGPMTVRLLGAATNGLWYNPLIRFHVNDYVGIGTSAGMFINTATFVSGWDAQLDLLVIW